VSPHAKRVEGYPLRMPSYADQLDDVRLTALVAWILARPGEQPAPAAVASIETDPVCGMDVRADAQAIQSTRDGKTSYFCSTRCKDRFDHSASAQSGKHSR
jgi:YHS domain-containing protein